jgi:hypothetical protein
MATDANIKLPDNLLAQVLKAGQVDGQSADELVAKAVEEYLYRRDYANFTAGAEAGKMTDDEAVEFASRVVHDFRREHPEFYNR